MLEYLAPYKHLCDLSNLIKIKEERETWKIRKNSEKYINALNCLPKVSAPIYSCNSGNASVSFETPFNNTDRDIIKKSAIEMIPWRKGPFQIETLHIDSEWRSDLKWNRLSSKLESLEGKTILDIGCSNGYFMFKMAEDNPKLILGIDPVSHCFYQYKFLNHFFQYPFLNFELFGVEHVNLFKNMFDTIFFMGIIYHHRNPILQLQNILNALKPGGQVLIETIGIPGNESFALFPEDRYANMRNVWFVPTLSCLINWTKRAKFIDVEVISSTKLTNEEQRLTKWCPPPHQSLDDFLDENDSNRTIEGHQAPMRFLISAKKRPKNSSSA